MRHGRAAAIAILGLVLMLAGCARPRPHHQGQFLICGECGSVREIEAPALTAMVEENARREGFSPIRQTIEVHGTCGQCA